MNRTRPNRMIRSPREYASRVSGGSKEGVRPVDLRYELTNVTERWYILTVKDAMDIAHLDEMREKARQNG